MNEEVLRLEQHSDRRPRLLIVTTVATTLASILRSQPNFLAQYYDVHLACSHGNAFATVAANEGVPVHAVSMVRGINPVADVVSVLRMVFLIWKLKPDAVHSYTPKAGLVAMLASWLCFVPLRIHTFTGLIFPTARGKRRKVLMWVDRLICYCASHIIPESSGVRRDLQEGKITRKPLRIIGHGNVAGIDVERFCVAHDDVASEAAALRSKLKVQDDDFVFAFVGRLNRDKGITELLAAFSALPLNARLVLVGALDASQPISESALREIEKSHRISWVGSQVDVRPVLQLADVLVLPSYREGFPNVVLEAGAMQLPVIATDISGSNEAITEEFNGWLVPVQDVDLLEHAMLRAMKAPQLELREMGKRARARVVERFERKSHLIRLRAYYNSILTIKD